MSAPPGTWAGPRPTRWARLRRGVTSGGPALLALIFLIGCEADVHDGVGPIVPVPNVTGQVLRAAQPASDLEVELRDAGDALVIATTSTDAFGAFGFTDVPAGEWEIKVSGEGSDDFDSVTRAFVLAAERSVALPTFDISAHGAGLASPADSTQLARPNPFSPLAFHWALPATGCLSARVQVYDESGERAWSSNKALATDVAWNGLGNEGEYAGSLVPAGLYRWRVRFALADSTEARTETWELILQ